MTRSAPIRLAGLALLLTIAAGCSTPIGVERVDARRVYRELNASAVSSGRLSAPTRQALSRLGLREAFAAAPDATLALLHERLGSSGNEDLVFALAELSFHRGEKTDAPAHYLAAAVYAYAFLFPGASGSRPNAFDPRFRIACELYNRGLTEGLATPAGSLALGSGVRPLPFGAIEIDSSAPTFRWAGLPLGAFTPSSHLQIRGLRNRYRRPGIGAPLAGSPSGDGGEAAPLPGRDRLPRNMPVPVTALLQISEPRQALAGTALRGSLKLHTPDDARSVTIDGRDVPLEFETTSSLALGLEGAPIWDLEIQGFRFGELSLGGQAQPAGVTMLHPYRAGRIPVVLVHGTASSGARWAELINELENDERIWERYQIWLFSYPTGNPVAFSAGLLRAALSDLVLELDPSGADPALRRMVVIGHSQGGLLTKLTAIDSGTRFWADVSDVPIDSLELEPETRRVLEQSLFFEPLPFVRRLVFIATPHRGSYLTAIRLGRISPVNWIKGLVTLPGRLSRAIADVVASNPDATVLRRLDQLPTSIDNMTPGNPFLVTLSEIPIAPDVRYHSIIAVQGDGPQETGSDGVVRYESAHLPGAASELVVRSRHSTQAQPDTIEEVRRILLEHADAGLACGTSRCPQESD